MEGAFTVTVEIEDDAPFDVLVTALPPLGAVMVLGNHGASKVKTVEYREAKTGEPLKIVLQCVPILHF